MFSNAITSSPSVSNEPSNALSMFLSDTSSPKLLEIPSFISTSNQTKLLLTRPTTNSLPNGAPPLGITFKLYNISRGLYMYYD